MLDLGNIIVQEKKWSPSLSRNDSILKKRTNIGSLKTAFTDFPKEGQFYIGPHGEIFQRRNLDLADQDILVMAPEYLHKHDPDKIANNRDRKDKLLRLKLLCEMRDTVREILDIQLNSPDSLSTIYNVPPWANAQEKLNSLYAAFVHAFGPINKLNVQKTGGFNLNGDQGSFNARPNLREFREDPDCALVSSIEIFNEGTHEYTKAEIFSKRVLKPKEQGFAFQTFEQAMRFCLYEKGRIDLDFICSLLPNAGSAEEILEDLQAQGLLFFDPDEKDWVPAEEYLSGNIRRKLDAAHMHLKLWPQLQTNMNALQLVLPKNLKEADVEISLGMHWIPANIIKQFTEDVLGYSNVEVNYVDLTHTWLANGVKKDLQKANHEYGTFMRDALSLLRSALQKRKPIIKLKESNENPDDSHEEEPKANSGLQTRLACDKMAKIQAVFKDWIWQDPERAEEIKKIYNEKFNSLVPQKFNGSGMHFPGASVSIEPRPHQRDVAWRNTKSGSTLYLHEVGAGKTFASALASMEMKRLGKIQKPCFVLPNHMLDQFSRDFMRLYPNAHILVLEEDQFKDDDGKMTGNHKLRAFVERASAYPWDAIFVTQSNFDLLKTSPENRLQMLLDDLSPFRDKLRLEEKGGHLYSYLQKECGLRQNAIVDFLQIKNYFSKMEVQEIWQDFLQPLENLNTEDPEWQKFLKPLQSFDEAYFERSRIDYLFIDEGQDYKNLPIVSGIEHMSKEGSDRAISLNEKLSYLRRKNPHYCLSLMTATPVSNAISEQYTMQKYMRPDLFEDCGIKHFDAWVAMFAKDIETIEMSPDGSHFRARARIAEYKNIGESSRIFHSFADVVLQEDLPDMGLPKLKEGKSQIIRVPQTETVADIFDSLDTRADMVRSGMVTRKADNMLKITMAARLATLHPQLAGVTPPDDEKGKIYYLVEQVSKRYHENKDRTYTTNDEPDLLTGSLQIIFSDLGIPKGDGQFSVYGEIRDKLMDAGIPADQIRFIHDYKSDKRKAELFEDCRQGRVSVLLGTTAKLGTGTNVQKRLIAEHHLDAPWRPADMIQRLGRMMRQGNQNSEVEDLRYVMEGSFDLYMWQTLERKLRFILQILKGDFKTRTVEEIDQIIMPYVEARLAGSKDNQPLVREKIIAENKLSKLSLSRDAYEHEKHRILFRSKAVSHQLNIARRKLENTRATEAEIFGYHSPQSPLVLGGRDFYSNIETEQELKNALGIFRKRLKDSDPDQMPSYMEEEIGSIYGFALKACALRRQKKEIEANDFEVEGKNKRYEFKIKISDPLETEIAYYKKDFKTIRQKTAEISQNGNENLNVSDLKHLVVDFSAVAEKQQNSILTRIINTYDNLSDSKNILALQVEKLTEELVSLEAAKTLAFDYEEEYQALVGQLTQIDKKLIKKPGTRQKWAAQVNSGTAMRKVAPAPF